MAINITVIPCISRDVQQATEPIDFFILYRLNFSKKALYCYICVCAMIISKIKTIKNYSNMIDPCF